MKPAVYNTLQKVWQIEPERRLLFVPVLMGLGIALYFRLLQEPPLWSGFAALLLLLSVGLLIKRYALARTAVLVLLFMALGFTAAQVKTHFTHSPHLNEKLPILPIQGVIEEITPRAKGCRLMLSDVIIDRLAPAQTPKYITVTLRQCDAKWMSGERVSLRAGLFPPPGPSVPGGFDFNRYFYFKHIGAVGFGVPPVESVSSKEHQSLDGTFARWRRELSDAMRAYFTEPEGAVAAAFVTGEISAIPTEITEDMRNSGLYHLLAVSGMNLSIVAGIAFFALRFLLAAIAPLALRFNIKKWAAIAALLVSYMYLRIAGSPVSAERAFLMVSLIFLAIIFDRDPTPMRSLAIAAFCLLLYEPESALSASFQLSFSATAAIIASLEWGLGKQPFREGFGLSTIFFYFVAVFVTSLVAWLATEPIIIYQFNQFSSYSLLANVIADPLVSFILMPLVVLGLLLMPFGLGGLAFTPMQWGVKALLALAHWVAGLPHAMILVPSPTTTGFLFIVLGGVWIFFRSSHWRWLGLILIAGGMLTMRDYRAPDVFISGDAKTVAARDDAGTLFMLKGRPTNFLAEQWAHAALQEEARGMKEAPMRCDKFGCLAEIQGKRIAILKKIDAAADDCRAADIVITKEELGAGLCSAPLVIDKTVVDKGGATALWFNREGIEMRQVKTLQGGRPWVVSTPDGEDD